VHDLLGLGLSAVALKADLITALIGRDDARAVAEMEEMGRVCAAARTGIRRVTVESPRLSLSAELATAKQILTSAGINVSASMNAGPLLAVADGVLAPVLREAVTNILRHAAASACIMKVTVGDSGVRLHVRNDGVAGQPAKRRSAMGGRRGLANLTARVQVAGGRLTTRQEGGRLDLIAQMPLPGTRPGRVRAAPASVALTEVGSRA
jgi:two-component system sensor histidine kinase DesK